MSSVEQGVCCPQGHALELFSTPSHDFVCDGCNLHQAQFSKMFGCRECDYDLCMRCAPACPQGHASMRTIVGMTTSGHEEHWCDKCNKTGIKSPEEIFRCHQCDYDVCLPCVGAHFEAEGLGDRQPQPSEVATATPCGISFQVEPNVKPGGRYNKNSTRMKESTPSDTLEEAWSKFGETCSIEAMSPSPPGCVEVFTKQNLFAKAVHAAFYGHHPLVLSPDVVWITIAQGLANHVDQNSEALRSKFVFHEGKQELVVDRPGFVKGCPANDWPGVFPEFSTQIKQNTVPGTVELIESDFSTTGPVERIVSHITLMDAVQHYFTYTMAAGCGFPSITLRGTPEDWKKIRAKAASFSQYDLDWWLAGLLPVLDQFVEAAEGRPDVEFWRSLCMINTGTSFPCYSPLTGWVQVFFPYLIDPGRDRDIFSQAGGSPKKKMKKNTAIANYMESYRNKVNVENFGKERDASTKSDRFAPPPQGVEWGVKLQNFPPAMSNAPFTFRDQLTGKSHAMTFSGGVACLVQHEDGSIEPVMGWAVLDSGLRIPYKNKEKVD